MLRHIVLLTFKDSATEAERQALHDAVSALKDKVPEVLSLTCGANVGSGPNHHDYALVADFEDMAAFKRYIASPAHRAYVDGPAKAVARIAAIQQQI
ncbi:Dabb family protein [Oceanibium sediminis]|uniref:Dabb family protein n=1 Tax=Oceanibium sediminis TaxID=2026339 RepID=UPI000DD361D2|nr:Dabb family protein [Oceanibium sediminis]